MNSIFKQTSVLGVTAAVPKEKYDLAALGNEFGENIVSKVLQATGVETVRIAPAGKTASDYCITAADLLLEKMSVSRDEIDGLIFVTQTPDYILPATSAVMQSRLGLRHQVITMDINQGCAGFIYGLFQAYLLVRTGCCKKVLVCVGDTISKYIYPKDKSLRLLMGDAGSAAIVGKSEQENLTAFSFYTDGSKANELIVPVGGARNPRIIGETDRVQEDRNNNLRSLEHLYMNGLEIMNFALGQVGATIDAVLDMIRWKQSQIDLFAFHQANELVLSYMIRVLKLDIKKVPIYINGFGNTCGATIPVMLSSIPLQSFNQGKKSVLCGFGVGLSCAAMATSLQMTRFFKPVEC